MRAALALLLCLSFSCDRAWNAANQRHLKADVAQLARRDLECSMIGTTRDAVCRGTSSARDAAALAKSLQLKPLSHGDPRLSRLATTPAWPASATILYGAFDRPTRLRTASGSQFEYVVIAWTPSGNRLTLLTSYASG